MNKCDKRWGLGKCGGFLELKEVRHFPHDFMNFLVAQRTSSSRNCWMAEKLYFPRPRCVAVDGEGVLDDLNIIGIALRCHMTQ